MFARNDKVYWEFIDLLNDRHQIDRQIIFVFCSPFSIISQILFLFTSLLIFFLSSLSTFFLPSPSLLLSPLFPPSPLLFSKSLLPLVSLPVFQLVGGLVGSWVGGLASQSPGGLISQSVSLTLQLYKFTNHISSFVHFSKVAVLCSLGEQKNSFYPQS